MNQPSTNTTKVRKPRVKRRFAIAVTLAIGVLTSGVYYRYAVGRRHEAIAEQLRNMGCDVFLSHMAWVPAADSERVNGEYAKTEQKSTLPKIVDEYNASVLFRRISGIHILPQSDLPRILPLIAKIRELEVLGVYNSPITESQLAILLDSVRVKNLYLKVVSLPRTDIPWLNHEGLIVLNVSGTDFSNAAIKSLPYSLESLNIADTLVDDEGLRSLTRLTNLTRLHLWNTQTTEKAFNDLQRRMPRCRISR